MLLVSLQSVELLAAAPDAALVPAHLHHLDVGADVPVQPPGRDVVTIVLLDVEHSVAALDPGSPVQADPLLNPVILSRVTVLGILLGVEAAHHTGSLTVVLGEDITPVRGRPALRGSRTVPPSLPGTG